MLTNIGDVEELRAVLLEGYGSLSPLTEEQLGQLPLLEAVRHLNVSIWAVEKAERGEGPDLERHLAVRMAEIRALMDEPCL